MAGQTKRKYNGIDFVGEEWVDLPIYHNEIAISNMGRCKNNVTGGLYEMNLTNFNYPYYAVHCTTTKTNHILYPFRVMYTIFIGEIEEGLVVTTKNGDNYDVRVDNLTTITVGDRLYRDIPKGSNVYCSILNEEQVVFLKLSSFIEANIKMKYGFPKITLSKYYGDKYGVTSSTIRQLSFNYRPKFGDIDKPKRWRYLEIPQDCKQTIIDDLEDIYDGLQEIDKIPMSTRDKKSLFYEYIKEYIDNNFDFN